MAPSSSRRSIEMLIDRPRLIGDYGKYIAAEIVAQLGTRGMVDPLDEDGVNLQASGP
jgi:hypothetical protein